MNRRSENYTVYEVTNGQKKRCLMQNKSNSELFRNNLWRVSLEYKPELDSVYDLFVPYDAEWVKQWITQKTSVKILSRI